jgi:hypothetical protein
LLNHRDYDRDAILRQAPSDRSPTDVQEKSQPPIDTDNSIFLPLRAPSIGKDIKPTALALVLPTKAGKLAGRAANSFHRGCLHGIQKSQQAVEIDLYATDGTAESVYANYAAAVRNAAQFVVGPMLKSGVKELLNRQPQALVPTLLLQPSAGEGYYVMTLDAGQEATDLAHLLHAQGITNVRVIEQPGQRGSQQRKAFEQAWIAASGKISGRFLVRDPARDWQRLFDDLKELPDEKGGLVLFAAGNGDFARKARKFVPQQYSVFAVSINNNQASGSLLSEGLRFMEMPWFFTLPNEHTIFDAPQTRTLPIIRQRFFALGIDACLAVLNSPLWDENWLMNGISGNWQLKNGTFSRAGKLAFYRGGRLRELTP